MATRTAARTEAPARADEERDAALAAAVAELGPGLAGRVQGLARLRENWDGYGGLPAAPGAVECALLFLADLKRAGLLPAGAVGMRVFSAYEGDVCIDWESIGVAFFVWLTPEGRLGWWGSTPNIEEGDASEDDGVEFRPGMDLPEGLARRLRDIPAHPPRA